MVVVAVNDMGMNRRQEEEKAMMEWKKEGKEEEQEVTQIPDEKRNKSSE